MHNTNSLTILDSQYFFLMLHKIIGGTPLVYSVHLKGNLDYHRFEHATQDLVKAHPFLQFAFQLPGTASSFSEFKYEKLDTPALPLYWEDLTNLDRQEQEIRISDEYVRLLNVKTSLNKGPLYCFSLFKVGPREFYLFMGIAHVICDGLGSLQLLHQFFNFLASKPVPAFDIKETYNRVVEKINQYQPLKQCLEVFDHWNAQSKKESFTWNPDGNKINAFALHYETIQCKIDSNTTQKLISSTKELRVSLYSIIVTAYINYFFSHSVTDNVLFTLPTGGQIYPNVDASDYVGCFAQAITLDFDREIENKSLHEKLKHVHEAIHRAIRSEFDLIQTRKTAKSIKDTFKLKNGDLSPFTKSLFRGTIRSNVYISFTGNSPLKCHYDSFEIIDYREGTFNNAGVSDWMHTIFNGELYIFANYDTLFFEKETIQNALAYIKEQMCSMANLLCANTQQMSASRFTPATDNEALCHYLLNICSSMGFNEITANHIKHDLEAQLGLDSLGRIRLIAKISKDYANKIPKDGLFKCRTLEEFIEIIKTETEISRNECEDREAPISI